MIERSKLQDSAGRPLSQGLFLELGYNKEIAVFTLKDVDHELDGKKYISLKARYLAMEDVTEYDFAYTWLLGWDHWQRICANKMLSPHVDSWRQELEYKLRSRAAKKMIEQAEGGSYQATKWLLDRGWLTRAPGRPSNEEKQGHIAKEARLKDEFADDVERLRLVK